MGKSALKQEKKKKENSLLFKNNLSFRQECQLASEQADFFMGDTSERKIFQSMTHAFIALHCSVGLEKLKE